MSLLQLPPEIYIDLTNHPLIDDAETIRLNTSSVSDTNNLGDIQSTNNFVQLSLPQGVSTTPVSPVSFGTFNNSQINYSIAQNTNVTSSTQPKVSVVENSLINTADLFTITRFDEEGNNDIVFKFTLLPAIESSINGRQVPEVKPGILKRSSTNIKTFTLPGGVPAFQVLGLDTSILQLVGLFIGSESVEGSSPISFSNSKDISAIYTANSKLDATRLSAYFEEKFVQTGRPVSINISTNNSNNLTTSFDPTMVLSYKALLQNVRYFITRQDRVYYSLDALILDYPLIKSLGVSSTNTSNGTLPREIEIIQDLNIYNRDDEGTTSWVSPTASEVIYPSQFENINEYSVPDGYELKQLTVTWKNTTNDETRTEPLYFYVKKESGLSGTEIQTLANELYAIEMTRYYGANQ